MSGLLRCDHCGASTPDVCGEWEWDGRHVARCQSCSAAHAAHVERTESITAAERAVVEAAEALVDAADAWGWTRGQREYDRAVLVEHEFSEAVRRLREVRRG